MTAENSLDQAIRKQLTELLNRSQLSSNMVETLFRFLEHAYGINGYKWGFVTSLICECMGGDVEAGVSGAAAMELYALAADIFDDIQDQDNDNMPWRKIPMSESISIATSFLLLSYKMIESFTDSRRYRELCQTLNLGGIRSCDGQYLEFLRNKEEDYSLSEYLEIIKMKSGSLTGCACKFGALLGNASRKVVDLFGDLGVNLGIMAQIRNDLRDFLSSSEKNDLITRKKTLPIRYLMNIPENHKFKELLSVKELDPNAQSLRELQNMAVNEGVTYYCSVVHEIFRQNALEILEAMTLSDVQKGKLIVIVGQTF